MERPDPFTFAEYSYILAFISSGILSLTLLLGLPLFRAVSQLNQIMWFAMFTSAVGTFLAYAARNDFKRQPAPEDVIKKAKIGLRIHAGILILMTVLALIRVCGSLNIFPFFGI